MELFFRLVKLARPLMFALISGLPFSLLCVLLLSLSILIVLLLVIVALSPTSARRVERVLDIIEKLRPHK